MQTLELSEMQSEKIALSQMELKKMELEEMSSEDQKAVDGGFWLLYWLLTREAH